MEYTLAVSGPQIFGRLKAQVHAQRVLEPTWFQDLCAGKLTQQSSTRGNVVAYKVWVTNGLIEVNKTINSTETPGEVTEQITITGGTFALLVTFVTVDGVQVCTPMCWAAYGDSDYTKRQMLTEVLPYFRCMSNDSWRFNLAKIFAHPQDLSDVMALSYAPWIDSYWRWLPTVVRWVPTVIHG